MCVETLPVAECSTGGSVGSIAVAIVVYAGQLVSGPTFEFQENPGLVAIEENPQVGLRILMLTFTVLIVPVFEEVMFRGLLQSGIRSHLDRPIVAILITSAVFAALHPSMHWPALFVLSCCMGYAYEKSGSLIRSIIIHALFNGMNIVVALNS